jgi:hypothetical protein
MKAEMNWNEKQLLSWRPRRASNKLKDQIFVREPAPPAVGWFWGCLVPATACVLLTLLTVNHSNDSFGGRSRLSVVSSNLNYGSLAPQSQQSGQNHNDFVTFDSTNKSVFNSNMRFTSVTNFSNE